MNNIEEIVRFNKERGLHMQKYDPLNEYANITEELLESVGFDVPKRNRPLLKNELIDFVERIKLKGIATEVCELNVLPIEDVIDAYNDIIVFAVGAILKLGYNPNKTLVETNKEIHSRVGSIIDGKFEKDLSDEAKANWYKADYSKCKYMASNTNGWSIEDEADYFKCNTVN